ncbi:hypothetical protein BV011_00280B, partial [Haemophilus influenzae]
KIKMRF